MSLLALPLLVLTPPQEGAQVAPAPVDLSKVPPPPSPSIYASRAIPRGDPALWLSVEDYPAAALQARAKGTVGYRLEVDMAGRVAGCTIIASSGSALLDATTCKLLMRRARYSPAMGRDGKPLPSSVPGRYRWQLPAD